MKLEPFGAEAEFYRSGLIAATVANCYRNTKKQPKPFTPQDFMPVFSAVEKSGVSVEQKMRMAGSQIAAQVAMKGNYDHIPDWALSPAQRAEKNGEPLIVLASK